jgi:hypothetical protein
MIIAAGWQATSTTTRQIFDAWLAGRNALFPLLASPMLESSAHGSPHPSLRKPVSIDSSQDSAIPR